MATTDRVASWMICCWCWWKCSVQMMMMMIEVVVL